LRRYRATHCRKANMHESVLRAQLGHSSPDITSRYDKSGQDAAFVRGEVEKAGVGFDLAVL
jgi:hypothetical protein